MYTNSASYPKDSRTFRFQRSTGEVRAAWSGRVRGLGNIPSLRALELRPGGCLVVSVPGADEHGASVFERVLDLANAELATMVDQADIKAERDNGWRLATAYVRSCRAIR